MDALFVFIVRENYSSDCTLSFFKILRNILTPKLITDKQMKNNDIGNGMKKAVLRRAIFISQNGILYVIMDLFIYRKRFITAHITARLLGTNKLSKATNG